MDDYNIKLPEHFMNKCVQPAKDLKYLIFPSERDET